MRPHRRSLSRLCQNLPADRAGSAENLPRDRLRLRLAVHGAGERRVVAVCERHQGSADHGLDDLGPVPWHRAQRRSGHGRYGPGVDVAGRLAQLGDSPPRCALRIVGESDGNDGVALMGEGDPVGRWRPGVAWRRWPLSTLCARVGCVRMPARIPADRVERAVTRRPIQALQGGGRMNVLPGTSVVSMFAAPGYRHSPYPGGGTAPTT